jgi:hypothetical protein
MLNQIQKTELEMMGPESVRLHLMGFTAGSRGSAVGGFICGDMDRRDVYSWLADKDGKEENEPAATTPRSAQTYALASFVAVAITPLRFVRALIQK